MNFTSPDISIIIISFNTRDLLRDCLKSILREADGILCEFIVVDNASKDGSVEMVTSEFPSVKLISSSLNMGFGAANNLAFQNAKGKYIVLLNSDAFINCGGLQKALDHIKEDPTVGMGGAKLVSEDGSWQPSARMFPSLLNQFLHFSGLAHKYPKSRFFGRPDNTWAPQDENCKTDWVPGAFAIIPKQVLDKVGYFDERFFLYYEEVDLCLRIKQKGFSICYWPDIVVTHLGGASSSTLNGHTFSQKSKQLALWRMRSELIYFRKHHGAWGAFWDNTLESWWYKLRAIKNFKNREKSEESKMMVHLLRQAWNETKGGTYCPPRPW